MPIESLLNPCSRASAASRRKYGRVDFGIVVPRRHGHQARKLKVGARANRLNQTAGNDSGSQPAFDSSCDSFTSIITSSFRPPASSLRASFAESTVSIT